MNVYYATTADGGWLCHDETGRIIAVNVPGLGEGSFELLRDALAEADADLERRCQRPLPSHRPRTRPSPQDDPG